MTAEHRERIDSRPRVFGIGLNKTGTSSLHEALMTLGYRSLHHGGIETMGLVQRAVAERKPLLSYIEPEYDAFTDIFGLTYYFYLADVQYPGSRFILTVRDLDEWLDSRRRHVEKNQRMSDAGAYDDGFLKVDLAAWAGEYSHHEAVVRAYFADRPEDLLIIDVTDGDRWQPLCEFLDRPLPERPFPWSNAYRPWSRPREQTQAEVGR
jgi:hypothetical protein